MKPILRDVCCTFLPGKYPNGVPVPSLYNEVYRHWKTIWGDIFTKAGSPASLNAENFLRQDAIIVLHRKEEIVGLLTSSFFNLSASPIFDHPYLRPFSEDLVQKLKNDGRGMVCTAEYLSVHPEFRKSLVGVSLFEVLIGLGLKMVFKLDAKMMLATTVRPAKVYECGPRFGWVEYGRSTGWIACSISSPRSWLIRTRSPTWLSWSRSTGAVVTTAPASPRVPT
jgi:hypothetical protein